jgi:creatinine amidohydrolase
MPIHKYEELSLTDLAGLPRDKSVILIPTGPLEQHGPHLPLGTDAFSARYFAEHLATRLEASHSDWHFILFPTIFAGCDTLTNIGSIEVRPSVFRAYLYDCCKQFVKDGFRTMIAVNAHGGPRHMVVLEEVAEKMRWRHKARMISASSRVLIDILKGKLIDQIAVKLDKAGKPLTAEEREALKTDFHGGLLETSLTLAVNKKLVKPFAKLQPAIVETYFKIKRKSGMTVGEGLGYLGSPAGARPEIGQAAIEAIIDTTLPPVERFLNGEKVNKEFRSFFYYIPFFRTDFKILVFLLLYLVILGASVVVMNHFLVEMFK